MAEDVSLTNGQYYESCTWPVVGHHQLIGDNFFLHLVKDVLIRKNPSLSLQRNRDNLPVSCGLCVSGQTISAYTRALNNINTISNRVVILLGSVDIYNGADSRDMLCDIHLLEVFQQKFDIPNSGIILCTIPFLDNIDYMFENGDKIVMLAQFNQYIQNFNERIRREFVEEAIVLRHNTDFRILDLFNEFWNFKMRIPRKSYFRQQEERVSGTQYEYILWNIDGEERVINLISQNGQ